METSTTIRRRESRSSSGGEVDASPSTAGSNFSSGGFQWDDVDHHTSSVLTKSMTEGVSTEVGGGNAGGATKHIDDDSMTGKNSLEVPLTPKEANRTPDGLGGSGGSMTKLMKRESYKAQRKSYRQEKKRVANELGSMLKDPSIIVLADWLKVRGTLKGWTKLWCVLKPGLLLLYKSDKTHKSSHWVGTVLLSSCELIERPSKKDGFCFKLFHPMEQSIWATRGPSGETIGAMVQPLPNAYLIFRVANEAAGKYWMDALELALRCSSLLIRSMSREGNKSNPQTPIPADGSIFHTQGPTFGNNTSDNHWIEYDAHFPDNDLEDDAATDNENRELDGGESLKSSDSDSEGHSRPDSGDFPPIETPYMESGLEEFGIAGDAGQTEEVADENKSLIWTLVKQVRPGMDLSKVVLPTFILEPRSFLDKLTDYYYHADILSKAVLEDDPFTRMKLVTQWYLSGFYKKPHGLKKPYNPILGEMFRCFWQHDNKTRTFYIAEQVSHHPPVSAFYVTNRQDGFCISGSILAKSKFYGNSLSAILDGQACLSLLTRGEDYIITMPYAHCKGILLGTMTLELGGKINIECEKTGYHTEIEFKLKPFLGGVESANTIVGKIKLGKETLSTLEGRWDEEIFIIDRRNEEKSAFWNPTPEIRSNRLTRYTVPMEHQREYESERLWRHVTVAIQKCDQVAATEEKTLLEEAQREAVKVRKLTREEWIPRYFHQDMSGRWVYKHADSRPWDPRNDVVQYECDCVIKTKTRHRTPVVRASSIISVDDEKDVQTLQRVSRTTRMSKQSNLGLRNTQRNSGSSSPEGDTLLGSESSDSDGCPKINFRETLDAALKPINASVKENSDRLNIVQKHLAVMIKKQQSRDRFQWVVILLFTIVHGALFWLTNNT